MPYVTRLNHSLIKQRARDRLEILKTENARKAKKLKNLKLQDRLENLKLQNRLEILKTENFKKAKKLKYLKNKQDTIIKNTLKKI